MDRGSWTVYIVRCRDGSYYTGITTDLRRRLDEHNGRRAGGARYTRSRRPVRLVHRERFADRSEAARRESELRRARRAEKERLALASEVRD